MGWFFFYILVPITQIDLWIMEVTALPMEFPLVLSTTCLDLAMCHALWFCLMVMLGSNDQSLQKLKKRDLGYFDEFYTCESVSFIRRFTSDLLCKLWLFCIFVDKVTDKILFKLWLCDHNNSEKLATLLNMTIMPELLFW